ncbi:heparinase II/III family protein [Spirochaetia bacterium 38H-sp]|uniref:Heparinase II/III family protein n=1 Tax=Rarispira pelagica TaxID=3141764 RepID=A0ABU9UE93_9SPIR
MKLFGHLNWDYITDISSRDSWRKAILDNFRSRCESLLLQNLDVPSSPGGWMHQYICPEDGNPLVYTQEASNPYSCPQGHLVDAPELGSAWLALRHRELADVARDLALGGYVYSDKRFSRAALSVLMAYAEKYATFDSGSNAPSWMLKGKVFHQALTEALWSVSIIYAFDLLQSAMSDSEKSFLEKRLLEPIAATLAEAHDKLISQNKVESNYTAWLIAVLGCLGFLLGNDELVSRAIDGPGGFRRHLDMAVLSDGFEYEGSLYYHNFVVLAYCILAEASLSNGIDLYSVYGTGSQNIEKMWDATASVFYPDGSYPALNDGAYWIDGGYWKGSLLDMELTYVYEIASSRTGKSRYYWLLDRLYRRRKINRCEYWAVLYATSDIAESESSFPSIEVFKDSGIGVLRDKENTQVATLVFGVDGGSHTHHDRLALYLWPWSLDPGTPPYGWHGRQHWYKHSVAHNAIVIDGESQRIPTKRPKLSYDGNSITVSSDDLYDGVFIERRVALADLGIKDSVFVSADKERVVEWIFYSDGEWDLSHFTTLDEPITISDEYPASFMSKIADGLSGMQLETKVFYEERVYNISINATKTFSSFLVASPGLAASPSKPRKALVLRFDTSDVRIDTLFAGGRLHG